MESDTTTVVKDPVCGMDVEPRKAAATRERSERTYYFCSTVCAETFDEEPERFERGGAGGPGR